MTTEKNCWKTPHTTPVRIGFSSSRQKTDFRLDMPRLLENRKLKCNSTAGTRLAPRSGRKVWQWEANEGQERRRRSRRNWRKFDEHLGFSIRLSNASPQKAPREKATARRLLPVPEPMRHELHWGKLAYEFRGATLGIFLTSISLKRNSTGT